MLPSRFGLACMAVAIVPLVAIGALWLGANGVPWPSGAAGDAPAKHSASGTVGGSRVGYLVELSQVYVSRNGAEVSHAVRSGSELAPVLFLNQELEQRGAKWRVRNTDGLEAETFDVS